MRIDEHFRRRHPRSQELYEHARALFPSGVTHDGRWMEPYPLTVEYAEGAYKWDVDGNRLIDYWQGHGALLLGHAHKPVVQALQQQAERGTHFGANSRYETAWAEQVKQCFPHIEKLRFTGSGTEATMLAIRLARAFSGKPTIIRLLGHFHGWNDALAGGSEGETTTPSGILPAVTAGTLLVPANLAAIKQMMETHDDLAALIMEPSGASYGAQPLPDSFVQSVRELCDEHSLLLICDEVVTGFRVAPGGVQERAGIQADLTCLAKILAGGLPGGAVGGRGDVMHLLEYGDATWNEQRKIRHQGTFNANPLSAAAGIVTLEEARTGEPQARATRSAQLLRDGFNAEIRSRSLRGCVAYGDASIVHLVLASSRAFPPGQLSDDVPLQDLKSGIPAHLRQPFRLAMLNYGVDLMRGRSAFVSAAHSEEDISATIKAFGAALDTIRDERRM